MMRENSAVRTAQDLERKYDLGSIGEIKKNIELQKENLTKVENENTNILKAIIINLDGIIEDQSDISLWFFNGVPTLENEPYIDWTTYDNHIGDIYYDKDTGKVYIFKSENDAYFWDENTNLELMRAMALSNAEVKIGSERKVFLTIPTPPYQNGDWYIDKDNNLYICQITRDENEKYNENDFINENVFCSLREIVSDFSIYPSYKLDIENIKSVINNENIFEKIDNELSNINDKCKLIEIFNDIDSYKIEDKENEKAEKKQKKEAEMFKSIIYFPNFLLIALKLYLLDDEKKSKISLNSQSLLIHFNDYLMDKNFTISFIGKLFEYRLIFDNYIIKQNNKKENDERYRIQKYKKNKDNEKYYINTITNELEEDEAENDNEKSLEYFIIHLQTILENFSPTKQNKTWLYEALNSLINNCEENRLMSFINSLWKSLRENVSNLDFYKLCYPDISHKLFYYIDFLMLLEFKLNQNDFKNNYFENNESKFNNFKKIADDFEFASVSSVEHIYSRKNAERDGLNDEFLHCIGNLCLISSSQNTSLGGDGYNDKRKEWENFKRKYSLKQALVFCKYDKWEEDDINNHKEEIINLLEKYKYEDDLYSIITENKKNEYQSSNN